LDDSHVTFDEIFNYLSTADKPCVVAIDEFQQIGSYSDKNVEAVLRTYIQHCNNAHFIFAGSQRYIMGNMFLTPSRPFYQSVSMLYLESIPLEEYCKFTIYHFNNYKKKISRDVIESVYNMYDGITWYLQKMINTLFMMTEIGACCNVEMIDYAQKKKIL
jgi:Archaeal ATPase.